MIAGRIDLPDADATTRLGAQLADVISPGDVVTLSGPLGSGKTTFARGLLAALGLDDDAPSPSFPIVIPYDAGELRVPVWHIDLYRIEAPRELDELGLDEARADTALLIEWPERGGAWHDALALRFAPLANDGRRLTWTAGPSWAQRWPPPLR